ncbi:MAG: glycine cleavage system protein H [bacterium]
MFTIQNYEIHEDLFYCPEDHFWLRVEHNRAQIGMDPLVQESMGAFVVVQLDEKGKIFKKGDSFGTVEAEKYVGPLRSPISGVLKNINIEVIENPRLPNREPYRKGWLIEVELTNFEKERASLLTGEGPLREWFEAEIKKYKDEGWLAEL